MAPAVESATLSVQVPELGLGTAALFLPGYGLGPVKAVDGAGLIMRAVDLGVRYLDSAGDYGDSDRVLNEAAELLIDRRVRVCTKRTASALLEAGVAAALERRRDRPFDTLLVHSATPTILSDPRCADVMTRVKSEGRAMRVGASTYGAEAAAVALAQPWCDVVQVEYSVLNPSVVWHVQSRKRTGQEVVVRSVFCKGLLTDRRASAPGLPQGAREMLDRLALLGREWGMSVSSLALRFALDTPCVDVVLVGVGCEEELRAALDASKAPRLESWQLETLQMFDRSTERWTHPEQWAQ